MSYAARVSLARCPSYDSGLRASIERVLSPLGGLQAFVRPGQTVLIKPNLLTSRSPDRAVTTHPEVVRVLIHLVREQGADPSVGDSPANVMKTEKVWAETGILGVCREEDVPLLNFEESGSCQFEAGGFSFTVAKPVVETDVLLSVPKVKTHVLTTLTAAVKNMYGTIPGFQKTGLHKTCPRPETFGKLLAALYSKVRPHLSIADGVVGMEGDGPSGGDPVRLGLLAASSDAVAMDAILCRLLRIDPRSVPYLDPLREGGLGETDPEKIEVLGCSTEELAPESFRVPGTLRSRLIPAWLVRLLGPLLWIRPSFTDHCVRCGRCVKACPVHALQLDEEPRPELSADVCIGCCCCHEVCPENAVRMTASPLLNLAMRNRM